MQRHKKLELRPKAKEQQQRNYIYNVCIDRLDIRMVISVSKG